MLNPAFAALMMLNPVFAALIATFAMHEGVWMLRKGRCDVRMMMQIFLEFRVLAQVTRIINQRRIVAQRLRYFGMFIEVVVEMLDVQIVLAVFGGWRGSFGCELCAKAEVTSAPVSRAAETNVIMRFIVRVSSC